MAPFGGWDMPIQYEGILAEHHATRRAAAVFDTCHMGEFELRGPDAERDLERLLTLRVSNLRDGQCRYGYLLQDEGGILDDLTCYRFGPDRFWLIVNAGTRESDAAWIRRHLSPGTQFDDLTLRTGKLDVQGPDSRAAIERAFGATLPDLKYFHFAGSELGGIPFTVSRTGYTGEWGYELYFPRDQTVRVWDQLLAAGVRPAGLGARDTLRLEVGYPLYGHELGPDRTPIAASRGAFVDVSKDFIGKDAVARDLDAGCSHYLAGLQLEGKRAARAGDTVLLDGEPVGAVTSGSLAPSLGVAVALAYVDASLCHPGQPLQVESRGTALKGVIVELPFYKEGTARRAKGGTHA